VWTTFGPDHVDLNYVTPEVLLAVTELLLGYLALGAQIIRLDAVAHLWIAAGDLVHLAAAEPTRWCGCGGRCSTRSRPAPC
jgi:sucrose phosphorylase